MSHAEEVKAALRKIEDGIRTLQNGPLAYSIESLIVAHDYLMENHCPFAVGDRVMLKETPDFDKAPGWRSATHWLKAGAIGTAVSVEFATHLKCFAAGVEFDDESWIMTMPAHAVHKIGDAVPMEEKHTYTFRASKLVKL
jgi:hypothetical protein